MDELVCPLFSTSSTPYKYQLTSNRHTRRNRNQPRPPTLLPPQPNHQPPPAPRKVYVTPHPLHPSRWLRIPNESLRSRRKTQQALLSPQDRILGSDHDHPPLRASCKRPPNGIIHPFLPRSRSNEYRRQHAFLRPWPPMVPSSSSPLHPPTAHDGIRRYVSLRSRRTHVVSRYISSLSAS